MAIHKMQLYFQDDLYLRLKGLASQNKKSIAALVREAAQIYCSQLMKSRPYGKDPMDALVGRCHAKETELSERHDDILYK